jgi:hypothetical protein
MSYYVPLPAYNSGPGVNFEPLNQALDGVIRQNNANRAFDLQQKSSDRADQQFAMDKQSFDLNYNMALARNSAGVAQAALSERDPAKKAGYMNQLYGLHPEIKNRLIQHGIDPNDYDGTANFIVSEARGYVNPQETALNDAKIMEARAGAAKSTAEAAALRRQASLVNSLLPEFNGGVSVASSAAPSAMSFPAPVNNALMMLPPPQGNGLSIGRSTAVTSAPPPQVPPNALLSEPARTFPGSLPGRDAGPPVPSVNGMPDFAGGYRANAASASGAQAAAPSTSLPSPGDPTSFSGDSSSGLVTPSRISPDTKRAMAFDLALNGGKGMSTILNNDPGSKYATTYATKTAEDNAALNLKQKMTRPMVDIVHSFKDKLDAAGPEIADMATGPDYGKLSDDPSGIESWGKTFLPDTSGEFYQNARAGVRNVANATLGYIPGVEGITQPLADKGNAARSLNLELHHLVKGIGAGVKAIPGTKGGGVSTDADQALVLDAVGEAMHASDAPTRDNILFDAENILRARAGMPRLPARAGYQPSALAMRYGDAGNAAPGQQAAGPIADAMAGARDAIAKGADPRAVRQRLIQNGINPDGL